MREGIISNLPPCFYLLRLHPPVSALAWAESEQRRPTEKRSIPTRRRNRLHPEIVVADNGAQLTSHYCIRVWSEPTGRETDTLLISDRSGESLGNECKSHLSRPAGLEKFMLRCVLLGNESCRCVSFNFVPLSKVSEGRSEPCHPADGKWRRTSGDFLQQLCRLVVLFLRVMDENYSYFFLLHYFYLFLFCCLVCLSPCRQF